MIETAITRAFGFATPIVNAGMAMIARPPLAAAVSNAGGLGTPGWVKTKNFRPAWARKRPPMETRRIVAARSALVTPSTSDGRAEAVS